jgi:hypothetical protein
LAPAVAHCAGARGLGDLVCLDGHGGRGDALNVVAPIGNTPILYDAANGVVGDKVVMANPRPWTPR